MRKTQASKEPATTEPAAHNRENPVQQADTVSARSSCPILQNKESNKSDQLNVQDRNVSSRLSVAKPTGSNVLAQAQQRQARELLAVPAHSKGNTRISENQGLAGASALRAVQLQLASDSLVATADATGSAAKIEPPSGGKDTADSAADTAWTRQVGLALLGGGHEEKDDSPVTPSREEESEIEEDPAKDTLSASRMLSFMEVPAEYYKLKKAETSFSKFKEALKADTQTSSKEPDKKGGGRSAEDNGKISKYTEGIIDLVKSGYKSCMQLKATYEKYQQAKEDSSGDASALGGAKIAFETALSGTSNVLSLINGYQKSSGSVASMAAQAAIPAKGIVLSTISLIGRIVTLVQQGNSDFGKSATESQTESILSNVVADEEKKAEIKQILESDKFRSLIVATAEYRQQERDNPAIFAEFRKAKSNKDLQARLKKRYPDNYARIEEIEKNNSISVDQIGPEMLRLKRLGVNNELIDAIIGDQTLINHLEEVNEKRTTNAKIGIFTDLVNIGADIATLTGTGAVAGVALRAGTAAIGAARAGGNAIKFAARGKGAENFAGGAEGGLFGESVYDTTDILKSDAAKQERYFHSSRRLVDNIADHDKRVADAGKTPHKNLVGVINKDYGWVESKILRTGASATLIREMANRKTGNELVKYFMDKMKSR